MFFILFFLIQQSTADGLSYETVTQDGSNVITLEIFFSGFPRMVGLSFFPNLRHLTVVGQDLTKIEALECCPLLQELWVAECHLTVSLLSVCCYSLQNIYSSAKKKKKIIIFVSNFTGNFWTRELSTAKETLSL